MWLKKRVRKSFFKLFCFVFKFFSIFSDKKQNLAGLKVVILQALEEELKELKTSVEKLEKVSEQDDIDIVS